MIAMTDQLLNLQPSQKKADEMTPTRAKKTIGCHFPWRRLKAAMATTSNQPLANFHSRDCTENSSDFSEVRPTAIEASTPTTATAYNHSCLSNIIEKISPRAIPRGVHSISRQERDPVFPVVCICVNTPVTSHCPARDGPILSHAVTPPSCRQPPTEYPTLFPVARILLPLLH